MKKTKIMKVGTVLRMPNPNTKKGYRVWLVIGVYLGAVSQESVYELQVLDYDDTYKIMVPCVILENHPNLEIVYRGR